MFPINYTFNFSPGKLQSSLNALLRNFHSNKGLRKGLKGYS